MAPLSPRHPSEARNSVRPRGADPPPRTRCPPPAAGPASETRGRSRKPRVTPAPRAGPERLGIRGGERGGREGDSRASRKRGVARDPALLVSAPSLPFPSPGPGSRLHPLLGRWAPHVSDLAGEGAASARPPWTREGGRERAGEAGAAGA